MMNLLPHDAKKDLEQERLVRFLTVFGAMFSVILIIGFVLLWVPWITLTLQEGELEKQLDTVKQSPSIMRVAAIEENLFSLNSQLTAYQRNRTEILPLSLFIERVLAHKKEGISLTFFSYNITRGASAIPQFRIEGTARNRDALIAFTDGIDADPLITNVRSPISNFLQENNIKFTLTFDTVPSSLKF